MTGSPLVLELSDVTLVATSREESEVSEVCHRSGCIQLVTVPKPGTKRAACQSLSDLGTTKVRAARPQVAIATHALKYTGVESQVDPTLFFVFTGTPA